MKNPFHGAKFAALSLGCVAAGFLFLWAFVETGANHRLGSGMDKVGRFTVLSPCLMAMVLALASVIWNRRKGPGLIALIAAVAGIWVLYRISG
ncbi:MAG TPA: hypothetical protein VHX37_11805 [Acidobacteriaceae bacterium]|jgi:hypothetical protein|nr:hypothetical protein [Acidobacteriaceae bacterium]